MAKIHTLDELQTIIQNNPEQWRPLVFTNGCFDLLHVGHVRYLQTARAMGKRLVVGLNSDRSVQQLKPQATGYPLRPIIPQAQRAELLLALEAVDAVVLFEDQTAIAPIAALQPEIYVKGGDYTPELLPEYPTVVAYGGQVRFTQIEVPTSTTGLIKRILDAGQARI